MFAKEMFSAEYIESVHKQTGNDPSLIEKMLYAFGLLQAISVAGLPFVFKGGTSLLLLLDHGGRFSTDIDIIVKPGTDINSYIRKARDIFPFTDVSEDIRIGHSKIEKRHFRFGYVSPLKRKEGTILLDVVFSDLQYTTVIEKSVKSSFLLTEGDDISVLLPSVNCILGDKLTAFAPYTTGIPFGIGKELEVIKQLFDCGALCEEMNCLDEVKNNYERVLEKEIEYRGLGIGSKEVLVDTIMSCLTVASRGMYDRRGDYSKFLEGIYAISNHVFERAFSGEKAGAYAGRVMNLAGRILIARISEEGSVYHCGMGIRELRVRWFRYLQHVDSASYESIIGILPLLERMD